MVGRLNLQRRSLSRSVLKVTQGPAVFDAKEMMGIPPLITHRGRPWYQKVITQQSRTLRVACVCFTFCPLPAQLTMASIMMRAQLYNKWQ